MRFCFFEIDIQQIREFYRIIGTYERYGLDLCIHRSGNGLHFLSPTMVSKETWKRFHAELKDINPKCPMTTLRIEPNKYPHEREIWFNGVQWHDFNDIRANSIELVNLLHKWFGLIGLDGRLVGHISTVLKFVRYPLP